ncbi:MAG: hypothetical protein QW050_03440 [Candidatus Nitrosocaldaceae archaeon]
MNDLPNDFCEKILALDDSIRFAAIMDRSEQIIMQATRKNIQLLLPKDVRESLGRALKSTEIDPLSWKR